MSIVPSELRLDDPENAEWQQLMVSELEPLAEDKVLEEKEAGLAPSSTATSSGCQVAASRTAS